MLMRTDPFRDLDRLTQQLLGTNARPSAMLMDAWREGDRFVVEFDLPGVSPDSVDLDVERNVLTVTAQRPAAGREGGVPGGRTPAGGVQPATRAGGQPGPGPDRGRPTGTGCCGCTSRSPKRPSPGRSPSTPTAGSDQEITTGHTTETASSAANTVDAVNA